MIGGDFLKNYRKIYAMRDANKKRILEICPNCPNTSGIYFFLREEDGFKYAYIGQAKHLLDRISSHLSGYQRIDLSLKKHGLLSTDNPHGYKVFYLCFPESELDYMEQEYIRLYANHGYQLRNTESGGKSGKSDIAERKPARGYYDGLDQGYKNARRFIADLFKKHLVVTTKKDPPTKLQSRALEKFNDFINFDEEND